MRRCAPVAGLHGDETTMNMECRKMKRTLIALAALIAMTGAALSQSPHSRIAPD
jgi:hypothetical protein